MNKKIRIGNDIDIRWTLVDGDGNPYNLEGRDIAIEVVVNSKKRVRIKEWDVDENTVHFIYYGKDQKYTGPCDLKFIENDGEKEMVTFDTPAAFTLVSHSWQAVDDGEEPERIYLEYTTVTSELMERVGPKGDKGDKGEDGRDGRDGSDADVTAENIAAALGYVPADENAVPTTQEVTTTAAQPLIRFSSDNPQVALISADWRGPLAIFHFNNSTGYYLYDINGTVNHLYLTGGGFAVDVGIGTFRITHLAKKAAERVIPVARPFDEYIVDSHIKRIYSKPSSGIPASDLASGVIPDVSGFYTKPAGGIPMSDLASAVKKGVGSFYSVEAQGTLSTQDPLDIANDIDSEYNVYIVGTIASDIYDTVMDYGGGSAPPLHITQYEYDSGVYYFCGVISSEGGDVYSFVISIDESTGNASYTTTKFAKESDLPTVQSLTNAEIDTIWANAS